MSLPTAPAEVGSTGAHHVVAAMHFLPQSQTLGTSPRPHLALQLAVLQHLVLEGGEGGHVGAGGGPVVVLPAPGTPPVVAEAGDGANSVGVLEKHDPTTGWSGAVEVPLVSRHLAGHNQAKEQFVVAWPRYYKVLEK